MSFFHRRIHFKYHLIPNKHTMKVHPNELVLLYNAGSPTGKQTRALAQSMYKNVNEFEYEKVRFTTTIWRKLLDRMALRPKDLLNRAHPDYQNNIARKDLDDEGWLNVIMQHPYLIKAPIAITSTAAILCLKPTDVLKLGRRANDRNPNFAGARTSLG
jgi:arsenate reductase